MREAKRRSTIKDAEKRKDCSIIFEMMEKAIKSKPDKLGKYKEGGGCLHINKLSDIDKKELEKIIILAVHRNK